MDDVDAECTPEERGDVAQPASDGSAAVGRYTWRTFLDEHGHEDAATTLYEEIPRAPAIPASVVKARFENEEQAIVRASGVDEPFRADGETRVDGHGTPEAGTLVIGADDVVVNGSAVYEDRRPSVAETRAATAEADAVTGDASAGDPDDTVAADDPEAPTSPSGESESDRSLGIEAGEPTNDETDLFESADPTEHDAEAEADGTAENDTPATRDETTDHSGTPGDDATTDNDIEGASDERTDREDTGVDDGDDPVTDGGSDVVDDGGPDSDGLGGETRGRDTDGERGVAVDIVNSGVSGFVVVAGEDVEPTPARPPAAADWERVAVDPATFLGFDPDELGFRLWAADAVGDELWDLCHARYNLYEVPVLKGYYTWDDYVDQCYRDEAGTLPTDEDDEPIPFTHEDKVDALGFDPDGIEGVVDAGADTAAQLSDLVDERTVDVNPDLDEDAFFSTADGETTLVNRYDLEKAVPMPKKTHFTEVERYWVNEPYAFVIVFRSRKENEVKYYAVQPYMTRIESDLAEFLTGKLRTSIKYADEAITGGDEAFREEVIAEETRTLLDRYDLYEEDEEGVLAELVDRVDLDRLDIDRFDTGRFDLDRFDLDRLGDRVGLDRLDTGALGTLRSRVAAAVGYDGSARQTAGRSGISARPEPAVLEEDARTLSQYQVEKLLYYLKRDFIGYERIDPIKHDINVEDISCDGYDSPVFVYHSEYEQIITNVYHGTDELDDFVVKLAQRSGKGISKRRPQVDATLPDGSRAQLTLGKEVSDHGTNYTIRQFKDVPFTPVDLINWKTFSLDEMAFLWLCIENNKNLIFAGGTASGKTTSLNAVSLFIPSNAKIVSIEDTREVELPQRNWIASVTRPSFSDDDKGDVDEFDLLEAALRQRPDYIVMGEIRGEEGRTAFQVMSTGHTTYTTFHADSVGEVLKRFTTDPINVSKTMFTALDLVSIQSSTRVQGRKVRRNKSITEINHYDAENDEINVQDVYQWQAETDEFLQMGDSNTLEDIMFDRGWSRARLDEELRKRRLVLAYLIDRGLNSYAQVAATFQAFINDPETVLALMANDELERSLEDLREMESVLINVDRDKEAMVPRPDPDEDGRAEAAAILEAADDLLAEYRGSVPDSVAEALLDVDAARDVEADPDTDHETLVATAEAADGLDADHATDDHPTETAATDALGADDPTVAATAGDEDTHGDPSRDPGRESDTVREAGVDSVEGDLDATASLSAPTDEQTGAPPESPTAQNGTHPDGAVGPAGESSESDVDFDRSFDEGFDVTQLPAGDATNGSDTTSGSDTTDERAPLDGDDEPGATRSHETSVDDERSEPDDRASDSGDDEDDEPDGGDDEDDDASIDEWGFETVEPTEEGE